MKVQFENLAMTSLMLFLDNEVQAKGEAWVNHTGVFYPAETLYYGYYSYSSPYKQFVMDAGISGGAPSDNKPHVVTGVYVNSDFKKVGDAGGPAYIDHMQGAVYFTSDQSSNTISGDFAVKDFNFFITSESEEELLFETKFDIRPKINENVTGLSAGKQTYPAVFIKNNGGRNDPYALGGTDMMKINARAIILSDSAFSLDAACAIMKETTRKHVPVIKSEDLPFNALGVATNGSIDYTGHLIPGKIDGGSGIYVKDVTVSKVIANRGDFKNLNPDVYSAFVDFDLELARNFR
tara:strand:+ start:2707 stop:3585 length:879 start_codon:yes stop_codon:yes gene_type:complete